MPASVVVSLIAGLLAPDDVVPSLRAADKPDALSQLAGMLASRHHLDSHRIAESLLQRESLGSTGLGHGLAIPHGRVRELKHPLGAFARLATPIPFDAPDDRPVNLVFVLLVPAKATDEHLQILSELAQIFSDKQLREKLRSAPDRNELHRLITA